eukprot:1159417-Pelagomonas_calceolata.AAC.9
MGMETQCGCPHLNICMETQCGALGHGCTHEGGRPCAVQEEAYLSVIDINAANVLVIKAKRRKDLVNMLPHMREAAASNGKHKGCTHARKSDLQCFD